MKQLWASTLLIFAVIGVHAAMSLPTPAPRFSDSEPKPVVIVVLQEVPIPEPECVHKKVLIRAFLRDIQYGNSLYAGYFAMGMGLDPSGLGRIDAISGAARSWELSVMNQMKKKLSVLCTKKCIGKCPKKECTEDACKKDVEVLVKSFFRSFSKRHKWIGAKSDPNPNDDIHAGGLCYQWAGWTMIDIQKEQKGLKCLSVNWVGIVKSGLAHNYVRIGIQPPLSEQSAAKPKGCEAIYDPWYEHSPKVFSPGEWAYHDWNFVWRASDAKIPKCYGFEWYPKAGKWVSKWHGTSSLKPLLPPAPPNPDVPNVKWKLK